MIKAKDFLSKISIENSSKNEAQQLIKLYKLYNNLIKPDTDVLKKSKGKSKNIRSCILNVLENIESSLFEGYYLNHKNLPEESNETDMAELESEESAAQRRNIIGQGLKILTPNQMLSRLPICLAQLKARNNSEKLKIKIRQLLYSLYRSKKLTENIKVWLTLYKNGNNLYNTENSKASESHRFN